MTDESTPDDKQLNISMVVVNILICVFGLFLNLLSLIVMVTLKEYKKSSLNRYLIHLAFADTLFLMTVPFGINETLQNSWNFPGLVCQITQATLFINYYASILFLMVMSVDRYTAVCKPFNTYFMKFRSARGAHFCSGLIWAVAIAGSIPVIKYSMVIGTKPYCRCQLSFPAAPQDPEARCKLFFNNMQMNEQSNFNSYFVEKCISDIEKSMQRACREDDDTELSALGAFLDLSGDGDFVGSGASSGSGDDFSYPPIISSADFALPNYTYSGDTQNMFTEGELPEACNYNGVSTSWHMFIYINFILFFLLPITVMALTYGLIIARLQQNMNKLERRKCSASRNKRSQSLLTTSGRDGSQKETRVTTTTSSSRKLRREQRVTLLCIILLIAFLICWLPFFLVHLIKISGISNATPAQCVQYTLIGSVLARMNSLLNPILYNFLGVGFCARLRKARTALTSSSGMSFNKSEQFNSKKNKQRTSMKSCSSSGVYPPQKPKSNDLDKQQEATTQLTRCHPTETEF